MEWKMIDQDLIVADRQDYLPQIEQQDVDDNLQIRRTLVVALGGTGQRVAVDLKAFFHIYNGRLPDWLRIKAFDTATEPLLVRIPGNRSITLEPQTEFINIGKIPVGRIIQHKDKQRAIAERFGQTLLRLPPTVLINGAKQERSLGLLSLYWHYQRVEDHLKRAIRELMNRDNWHQDDADIEHGLNVFIINSLCGGTGAGIFLDVAFLVRALVDELGDLGDFCKITGIGVLPGAFNDVKGYNLKPNTVASLMELNHVMLHNDFQATYPNGRMIQATSAPFNLYYVLDGVDERGNVWSGINEVAHLAAHALYLQMGSQIGRKGENDFDNLDDVLGGVTEDKAGTFLGSIGVSTCRFDTNLAYQWVTYEHCWRLINEGWLHPVVDEVGDKIAKDFWKNEQLDADVMQQQLTQDEDGNSITVNLVLPANIRRFTGQQRASETVTYVEDYDALRIKGTFRQILDSSIQSISEKIKNSLDNMTNEMANNPELGVLQTQSVLNAIKDKVNKAWGDLEIKITELSEKVDTEKVLLEQHQKELMKAGITSFFQRSHRVNVAQHQYINTALYYYQLLIERDKITACQQVYRQTAHRITELNKLLVSLKNRLLDISRQLRRARIVENSGGLPADIELLNPDYLSVLYSRYTPALQDTASHFHLETDLADIDKKSVNNFAEKLLAVVSAAFHVVLEHDIEQVLLDMKDTISIDARRQMLMQRAIPAWNIDQTRLDNNGANMVTINILGVPDEQNTIFAGDNAALVSIKKKEQIIAMKVCVGAPYTALQQFPVWHKEYEEANNRLFLHILPAFHTSMYTSLQAFALGLVFGLIATQGSWYYYIPADRLDSQRRLGQGLQKAVQVFTTTEGLPQEVLNRIESEISVNLTTSQAIERIDAYYSAGEKDESLSGLSRQLRKAARGYADELRQMLAASEGILTSNQV